MSVGIYLRRRWALVYCTVIAQASCTTLVAGSMHAAGPWSHLARFLHHCIYTMHPFTPLVVTTHWSWSCFLRSVICLHQSNNLLIIRHFDQSRACSNCNSWYTLQRWNALLHGWRLSWRIQSVAIATTGGGGSLKGVVPDEEREVVLKESHDLNWPLTPSLEQPCSKNCINNTFRLEINYWSKQII